MIRKLLYILGLVLLVVLGYLSYDFYSFNAARNNHVEQQGRETTAQLKNQVDEILSKIADEGERLAELFGKNDYSMEEVEEIIKKSALSIPEIQGVTACYEPNAFSDVRELYCPYYDKGTQEYLFVGESYDYSKVGDGTAWYTSVRDGGKKWVEPYFAKAAQDWYVDYGIPFYYSDGPKKGKVRGTITMSFICGGFKNLVHSLSLGKTGYGLITSNKGNFLAHPINEYIGTTNISEVISVEENQDLVSAYQSILKGEKGQVSFYNEEQDDETIFYYDTIPTSGWGMGLLFYRNDLLGDQLTLNRKYIVLSIVLSLFFLTLLAIYFNKDYLDRQEIWKLSIVSTVLLGANMLFIGILQHNSASAASSKESPPIVDMTSLGQFINDQHNRADKLKIEKATPIPTGIFIQRLAFEDSYNLNAAGTVWQKYPLDIADSVSIGFTFPQLSPFAEASYIEESYREIIEAKEDEDGYLLVGWEFRVTLQLNFNYANYPLDKRHISIDLQPLNNNDHLIFVPNLSAYNYTNPVLKPGLSDKIVISGSEVTESYFNYSLQTFDADFGYGIKGLYEDIPVLHYNINLRRILLNAFVTYLIPIFVTLVMIFILIHACEKTNERQGIIESMAAFFFVLIFSHIDLRKEIVTADLIYIEYFYFVTYFIALLATFNMITYAKNKSEMFNFNDNQIFKAVYFPLFFAIMLVVTLVKFY